MRIAAISDVHGNLPALEAVLADISRAHVDIMVNLGDLVSGPLWVAETADRLVSLDLPSVRGNHERQLLSLGLGQLGASDAYAASKLQDRHRAWIESLPATLELASDVFCCHGTPASDMDYFLETVIPGFDASRGQPGVRGATSLEATERAGRDRQTAYRLILCGHTHLPRVQQLADGRVIVNPGSVGLPAYGANLPHPHVIENGSPHARYSLLTRQSDDWQIEMRCVPYDWRAAARLADQNLRRDWAVALRTGFVAA